MAIKVSLLSRIEAKVEADFPVESVNSYFKRCFERMGQAATNEVTMSANQDPRYKAVQNFVLEDMRKYALQRAIDKNKIILNKYLRPSFGGPTEMPEENKPYKLSIKIAVMNAKQLNLPKDPKFNPKPSLREVPKQVIEDALDRIDSGNKQGAERDGFGDKPKPIRKDRVAAAAAKKKITTEYLEYVKNFL